MATSNHCDIAKQLNVVLGHVIDGLVCGSDFPAPHEGIHLPFGDHVITVKLDAKPQEVFVSLDAEGGMPVCGGDVSTAGVTVLDDGFVLYAHVKSDHVVVRWVVKG